MTSNTQRALLQAQIWKIANEVRGAVDGWDFKQFVLGTLFYRFISENFTNYIEGGDESVDFINETDLDTITDKASIIESFFEYAQCKQTKEASELITSENLNEEEAKRYITVSLKREFVSDNGTDFNSILPKMSPLNPMYLTKKHKVSQLIAAFVEKFKGVGGKI